MSFETNRSETTTHPTLLLGTVNDEAGDDEPPETKVLNLRAHEHQLRPVSKAERLARKIW